MAYAGSFLRTRPLKKSRLLPSGCSSYRSPASSAACTQRAWWGKGGTMPPFKQPEMQNGVACHVHSMPWHGGDMLSPNQCTRR